MEKVVTFDTRQLIELLVDVDLTELAYLLQSREFKGLRISIKFLILVIIIILKAPKEKCGNFYKLDQIKTESEVVEQLIIKILLLCIN